MSKKFQLTVTVFLCLVMLLVSGSPAMAADATSEPNEALSLDMPELIVLPMSMYISRTATAINIGTYGETTATGSITGYPGITDQVIIYLYLQRYVNGSWQNFNSWYKSSPTYYATLVGTDVVPHGYYYRVKASYYAIADGNVENQIGYSSTVYY